MKTLVKTNMSYISDRLAGKLKAGESRSTKWPEVRAAFLKANPVCVVCESTKKLQVHHMKPFHLFPALELDPANLITLCENSSTNHHFMVGHLEDWRSFNPNVILDAKMWWTKLKQRQYDTVGF